ncbi:MAG: energy-coupling factor ABC transporter ATP-binding protein [Lachnospiraceae bacterium]|nr:energy-coupling factor ABC transporter ATP-binding protein [Lachnospiraceae bacterium]
MSFIELRDITFRYEGEESPVLSGFSMSAERGSCLIIEGDNGSGKTTLLRILSALSFPEKGSFVFDGCDITEKYMKVNMNSKLFHKRVGYLFQDPDIMLFNARVRDEIAFGPRQMGLGDEEVDKRVRDCMELFDIEKLSDKAPYHLSGGQKKRVAFASVMALNPEVLLLDEPYAGLDRKSREQLTAFLTELKRAGKTLLIASHDSEILSGIYDERLVMM